MKDLPTFSTDFMVLGDDESMKEISDLVTINRNSNNIVLCVGDSFSYAGAIDELQKKTAGVRYFFHGKNTQSIIGSASSENQGLVISK